MRVSTISIVDYVNLIGHYNKLQHGPSIDPRLLSRFEGKPEMLEKIKNQAVSKTSQVRSLNVRFTAPLENFTYPLFAYVLTLYKRYSELGVLPFSGAMADQPAQIIEIFNTLESVELEIKQQESKKQQKELERKSRRRV